MKRIIIGMLLIALAFLPSFGCDGGVIEVEIEVEVIEETEPVEPVIVEPVEPIIIEPVEPVIDEPVEPITPVEPVIVEPVEPIIVEPVEPVEPIIVEPVEPVTPVAPVTPIIDEPVAPVVEDELVVEIEPFTCSYCTSNVTYTAIGDWVRHMIKEHPEEIGEIEIEWRDNGDNRTDATPYPETRLTSEAEVTQFLSTNFGTCETSIGPTSFEFVVYKNDLMFRPYDYDIWVKYDTGFFVLDLGSKDVSKEMNHQVCEELKAHQEKLAKALIALMPGEKLTGGYIHTWYKYPAIRVGFESRNYYTWVNYTPAGTVMLDYDETTVSSFQWYSTIDDSLAR